LRLTIQVRSGPSTLIAKPPRVLGHATEAPEIGKEKTTGDSPASMASEGEGQGAVVVEAADAGDGERVELVLEEEAVLFVPGPDSTSPDRPGGEW
jgi:hypothetical protein